MSIINQMLQDLDKRNAGPGSSESGAIAAQVRPVARSQIGSEWFWRVLAVVMLITVCWIAWLMWELSPRSVVTDKVSLLAKPPAAAPVSAPATESPAPASSQLASAPAETASDSAAAKPAARLDMLRLATEITTPIPAVPRARRPVDKETVAALGRAIKPEADKPATANSDAAATPAAAARSTQALAALRPEGSLSQSRAAIGARIDRRDTTSIRDKAEVEFRRAVGLVNQGRVAEGMEAFRLALQIDPAHDTARQTMVALQIESKRYDDAAQTLGEGIAASPKNIQFVMLLARLLVERNDAAGALLLLDKHEAGAAGNADFRAFRAALQQRMGRHAEAIEEYRAALAISPGTGQWWIGLGISQQAQAQGKDALESFRRAKGAGNLTPELVSYVEQRIRQLQN